MTTAYTLDAFSTNVSSFDADPVDYQLLIPGNSGFLHTKVPDVEYHWGLGKGDFKTDSPVNRFEVRKDIPDLLKRGRISIVPTLDTLEKMLKVVESHEGQTGQPRPYTESFPVQEYEYVLVAKKFFEGTIYVRNPASGEVQSFESPYQGLPSFLSLAHPYCVALWCAGGILMVSDTLSRSPWGSRTCTTLMKLLHAWYFKGAPLAFIAGPDYENEGSEDLASDSCDSEFKPTTPPQKPRTTNARRFYDGYLSTRKRQNIESWIDSTRAADQDQEQIFPHS
ncbi:hypothetical protein K435DRAFT_868453 [Dendrothele bispora CBS 962.96]|uniref:Uncharacterized protein n=1 Tax=Dendrothele bispora (strain CBS 962.96) TaxID=1314807 RepID=A0A4S8LBS8_DENBC|nr:hypothetical protein K435DRAFT_868453 [Dendrothele bispora CBS 962.96]